MDEHDLGHFALYLGLYYLSIAKQIRPRRYWVNPIYQNRFAQGDYHNLIQELRLGDGDLFFNYTRMSVPMYEKLLRLIAPSIQKNSRREFICPDQRLLITLRFLATGDSYSSLGFAFRVAKPTICAIVHETCAALWRILMPLYLPEPTTADFKKIAQEFLELWNFPHCIGSIDGKHVRIQAPIKSGSKFFNYKDFFSMVLLATCNANYCFVLVDCGAYGSESDGGIFSRSRFGKALEAGTLAIPQNENFADINLPYHLLGDEAFPLKPYLLRPFPGSGLSNLKKIFNYRLSRARRVIENTFGILASRWRIYHRTIIGEPPLLENIIKSTVVLHNFIKKEKLINNPYCPDHFVDEEANGVVTLGDWRREVLEGNGLINARRLGSNNARRLDLALRDQLAEYFISAQGSAGIEWQFNHIQRGRSNIRTPAELFQQ